MYYWWLHKKKWSSVYKTLHVTKVEQKKLQNHMREITKQREIKDLSNRRQWWIFMETNIDKTGWWMIVQGKKESEAISLEPKLLTASLQVGKENIRRFYDWYRLRITKINKFICAQSSASNCHTIRNHFDVNQ